MYKSFQFELCMNQTSCERLLALRLRNHRTVILLIQQKKVYESSSIIWEGLKTLHIHVFGMLYGNHIMFLKNNGGNAYILLKVKEIQKSVYDLPFKA